MAEKILNTRILMKIDTLENWSSSSLKLKEGELAFATVAASAGTGLSEPVVMVKIGTSEEKTFSELPWAFHAKASDVLAACKNEESLKTFIKGVLTSEGVASDSVLQELAGKVTTAEGKITALEGKMTAVEGKASANETAIGELEELVGDESVATQIANKIAELKLGETYAAKSLETTVANHVADTVGHVTTADKTKWNGALQASDIATGSENGTIAVKGTDVAVKGLGSAAFTESTAYDAHGSASAAETAAKAYAKEYADGLAGNYDANGAAAAAQSAAETYAKNYADGLAGNYDASGSAAQALVDAKAYTDGEIEEWVGDAPVGTQISTAITDLDLANTYAAKSHKHVKADITDFAHTHAISEVTGLQDELDGKQAVGDYATKTEAQGYANAKDAAIEAAQAAADKAQGEVDALETYVGTIPEGYTEASVIAYVNKKAEETLAAASGNSTETAASVKAALDTYKTENNAAVKANADAIDALETLVGDTAVATQISTAVAAEAEIARAAEKANADAIKAIQDDYLVEADKTELQNQITTNANAIERLTNGVSAEEVDGVNDLIQYVKDHGTEVTGIKADIKSNSDAIDAIEKDYLKAADKTALQEQITANDGEIAALQTAVGTKAAQADHEALAGRVTTAEGKITTLEGEMDTAQADILELQGLVGTDKNVATQISDAITELKNGQLTTMQGEIDAVEGRATALEAKSHEHSNKTVLDGISADQVTAWDAAVQTVTAGTGLTATKTGTDVAIEIDETVTFIFDCGDSSNV